MYDNFNGDGPRIPTFGPNGNLYVPDWPTSNVKEFSGTNFTFLRNVVSNADISAKSVAFNPEGNLLVLDDSLQFNSVHVYNINTGAYLGLLVAAGIEGLKRSPCILVPA